MAERSTGARLYLSGIGLALALAGGLFSWLMWRSYSRALEIGEWEQLPCLIMDSGVAERGEFGRNEWRFEILYGYRWEGRDYESDRFRLRGSSWTQKRGEVEELVAMYPAGSTHLCRVNPENPERAVLRVESRAPGYSIWFPALIGVGGIGVVVGAWRR